MESITMEEKEIICDIVSRLREIAENDKTTIDNIKRFNFDLIVIAIALNSRYIDKLIKLERNKNRYYKLNNEFRRLINKIF